MGEQGETGRGREVVVTELIEPDVSAELEDLLTAPMTRRAPVPAAGGCLIATCVDDRHPALIGRVRVQIDDDPDERRPWVPTLHGLAVRVGDRVLMVRPGNGDEWIVTGVIDGFARRPEVAKAAAARLELKSDEALQVVSSAGQPLVEVSQGAAGPVVRLLEQNVAVEFAGQLTLRAEGIEFEATHGQVAIKAREDVVIKGELVKLN